MSSMMAMNRLRRDRKRTNSIISVSASGEGLLCFAADGSWFEGQLVASDDRDFDLCGRLVTEDPLSVLSSSSEASQPGSLPDSQDSPTAASQAAPDSDLEEHHGVLLESADPEERAGPEDRADSPASNHSPPRPSQSVPAARRAPMLAELRRGSSSSIMGSIISPRAFEAAMRALVDVAPGAPFAYDVYIRDHEEGSEHRARFVPAWRGDTCSLDSKELQFTAEKRYRGQRADMIIQRRLGPALIGKGCVVFTGRMNIEYQFDYQSTPKWCL